MNRDALVKLFCELVQIDSITKHERAVARVVEEKMSQLGLKVSYDGAGRRIGGDCDNLIYRIPATVAGFPTIMLNTHLDTVGEDVGIEPVVEAEEVRSAGDTILGADAKAGVALILALLQTLRQQKLPHGELVIVFTIAEEIGLVGAQHLDYEKLEPLPQMGYVLDGGITPGEMTTQAPYANKMNFEIRGRAAHAGVEPEKGINSIQAAARAISEMKLGQLDDESTANIGTIHGGKAVNIVPEVTTFEGEARSHDEAKLIAQTEQMCRQVDAAAAQMGAQAKVSTARSYNGFGLGPDEPVVERGVAAAQQVGLEASIKKGGGGSDANIFNEHGIPSVIVAIGAHKPHTSEELLHIPSMMQCFEWLNAIVTLRQ